MYYINIILLYKYGASRGFSAIADVLVRFCLLLMRNVSLYVDFNDKDLLALDVLPFVILLGHSNSAVNPLLYCLMTRRLHQTRSTIRRRRPLDLTKATPATVVGDCVTLQLLGEVVDGPANLASQRGRDRAVDVTDGK